MLTQKNFTFFHEKVQNLLYFHNITFTLMLDDFMCMQSSPEVLFVS